MFTLDKYGCSDPVGIPWISVNVEFWACCNKPAKLGYALIIGGCMPVNSGSGDFLCVFIIGSQ